ncbi:hypothetical protein M9H77_22310 [Catharanthus roseus]|uniref:Uncharacterized protein n=1 Tax=Catharanthus roseus TaxID=4058 RepID=A0ACC0ASP5_CATRO|nr:hypothetical protein M9H77_22310 [Catharanthus roseus]
MKSILTISRGHARELLEYPYLLRRSRQSVQKDSIPLIVLNFEIILTDIHLKGRGEPMDSRILLLHLGRLMRLLTILIILFRQGNKNSGVRAASDLYQRSERSGWIATPTQVVQDSEQNIVNVVPPRSFTQAQAHEEGIEDSFTISGTQVQATKYPWKGKKCITSENLSVDAAAKWVKMMSSNSKSQSKEF